jgi:hypothetical protein
VDLVDNPHGIGIIAQKYGFDIRRGHGHAQGGALAHRAVKQDLDVVFVEECPNDLHQVEQFLCNRSFGLLP